MRPDDVARLAGVPRGQVQPASADELRRAYADTAAAVVVEVAAAEPAWYWRVGERYYLDDPAYGAVAAIDDLRYSSDLGLYNVTLFGEQGE